jgi:hypothetical protein
MESFSRSASGLNMPLYDPAKVERVIGVDPSEGLLKLGQARKASSPVPLSIVRAPAENIPLDNASVATRLSSPHPLLRPGSGRVLYLEMGARTSLRSLGFHSRGTAVRA